MIGGSGVPPPANVPQLRNHANPDYTIRKF